VSEIVDEKLFYPLKGFEECNVKLMREVECHF